MDAVVLFYLRIVMLLNVSQRAYLYRDLSRYIREFGIEGALIALARESVEIGDGYHVAYALWLHRIRRNMSFDSVLQGWVPETERIQIMSAKFERSGGVNALSNALERTRVFALKQKKLGDTLKSGIRTPLIYVGMLVAMIFGLKHVLLPIMVKNDKAVQAWPDDAQETYQIILMLTDNVVYITVGLVVFIIVIGRYCVSGHSAFRDMLNVIPPFSYYQIIVSGGLLLTLASLMEARVSISDGLELIEKNSNRWIGSHINLMRKRMSGEGVVATESITGQAFESPAFDKYTAAKLKSYAKTKDFKVILGELSDYILEIAEVRIGKLSERLNWVLLIFVGISIAKIGLMLIAANLGALSKGI